VVVPSAGAQAVHGRDVAPGVRRRLVVLDVRAHGRIFFDAD
jgi:hypothetical protein